MLGQVCFMLHERNCVTRIQVDHVSSSKARDTFATNCSRLGKVFLIYLFWLLQASLNIPWIPNFLHMYECFLLFFFYPTIKSFQKAFVLILNLENNGIRKISVDLTKFETTSPHLQLRLNICLGWFSLLFGIEANAFHWNGPAKLTLTQFVLTRFSCTLPLRCAREI